MHSIKHSLTPRDDGGQRRRGTGALQQRHHRHGVGRAHDGAEEELVVPGPVEGQHEGGAHRQQAAHNHAAGACS